MPEQHSIVLGIDFGTKRIGLAIGQTLSNSAQALNPINTLDNLPSASEFKQVINNWQPTLAIIGKPATASKGFNKKLNRLAKFLKEEYQLPHQFIDETLTTEQANFELHLMQTKAHQKQALRDSIAARLILETYFETL